MWINMSLTWIIWSMIMVLRRGIRRCRLRAALSRTTWRVALVGFRGTTTGDVWLFLWPGRLAGWMGCLGYFLYYHLTYISAPALGVEDARGGDIRRSRGVWGDVCVGVAVKIAVKWRGRDAHVPTNRQRPHNVAPLLVAWHYYSHRQET